MRACAQIRAYGECTSSSTKCEMEAALPDRAGPPLLELTTSQSQFYTGRSIRDMRLDKYLKVSRIIKRRTVANEACDQGRVLLNGRVARASSDVKPGDTIEVRFGTRLLTVEVVTVQETVHKEEASEMYRLVSEERIEKESGED